MRRVPKYFWLNPKVEVRDSSLTHGKATFARGPIEAGEVVEIWGEYSNGQKTVEYTDDTGRVEGAKNQGKIVQQWDTDLWSIEDRGSDEGYFINHACDSNVWFKDAFTLTTRRVIVARPCVEKLSPARIGGEKICN